MTVLDTALDPRTPGYPEARNATLDRLDRLEAAIEEARAGGGERAVTRHHARGKLLPRERIEMLVDQDAPFLELSPVAGWGTEFPVGAGVVTGIGVVEAVECVIIATDPTVEGTAVNPYAVEKIRRAARIASTDRLPLVNLVESAAESPGAGTPPGGGIARDLSRLSTRRVPTISVVFGPTSGDTAYLPALSDYTIMVRGHAKMLTHPRPRPGTNGSDVRKTPTAPADQLAEDERDALRLARQCVRRLNWRKCGPAPRTSPPGEPKYDAEDLLALAGPSTLFDPREVLARLLDGSEFDEFKPAVGAAVLAGWGELHGYPIGVLATSDGPQTAVDTQKAVHFIQLANATDTSLLLFRRDDAGTLGSGAVDALAHSTVPLLSLNTGRTGDPRFAFSWPADGPAASDDDGVIDPRDTRTVLGLCLSAVHSAAVEGAGHVGAFRPGKVDQ
ncbi:acetyl-CoA carboxylase carboxyltransferase subunit [Actinoplanes sp. LDG1-06]|uniref:Acetyl-CoA carboxylase carboxyltransferase subunit n=1 Tax=Paractinoplanes ovalisporus TaxID=2810368 RepID=A0ABS2ACS9_9ACTN|nr:carboxyl transferase domain-containing protein [Actinoplanes ovalisporus]MBM2617168.1 acetyl-CoA carboxylase carboxyltransferase subunit [Actinoplanes ovalisporus]